MVMKRRPTYHLLVHLEKDGTSSPKVTRALISGEDPGSITTNFTKGQWASICEISADSYTEAVNIFKTLIDKTYYDAWLRPYFCYAKQGHMLSGCARAYLKSIGIESC